jgi:hypothetical protein
MPENFDHDEPLMNRSLFGMFWQCERSACYLEQTLMGAATASNTWLTKIKGLWKCASRVGPFLTVLLTQHVSAQLKV